METIETQAFAMMFTYGNIEAQITNANHAGVKNQVTGYTMTAELVTDHGCGDRDKTAGFNIIIRDSNGFIMQAWSQATFDYDDAIESVAEIFDGFINGAYDG